MKGQTVETGEQKNSFVYADLLMDNAPEISRSYAEEAAILNKEIENPNVFNVAVVAKYGAGKSSAINTYLNKYRNKRTICEKRKGVIFGNASRNKYAKVSLASFNSTEYNENAMECSVLQQLLFSAKKSKLPNSRIERTNKSSWLKSLGIALLCTVFIFAVTLMGIEFSLFSKSVAVKPIGLFGVVWSKYLFLGLSILSLIAILMIVLHYHKLKKIKYKDFEAEINEKGDTKEVSSLINKFVNEVIYFFECINIDLVIYEDLDRLAKTEIFTKLRELNTIINASNKKAKKVTFLYAIKDDLFDTEEERAKFFEFILPIIPVINPMTARDSLEKKVKQLIQVNPKMGLEGKFIKGISVFIPDMRILKNTFNDYIVMFHKIFEDKNAGLDLNPNKLFALCLYKNLFPYDYALLECDKGLIPQVVDIVKLRQYSLREIENELKSANEKLNTLKDDRINSFEELKAIFIYQISKLGNSGRGATINPWKLTTFQGIDYSSIMHPTNPNYGAVAMPSSGIRTPHGENFWDVEKDIVERENNGIELINKKIAELKKQFQVYSSWSFSDVIKKYGVECCFSEDIKAEYLKEYFSDANGLNHSQIEKQIAYLRFLIAQNYIDERYIEYTSNYKAEILSPNDVKFVQAVQGHKGNFNYRIDNIISVIRWLDDVDFKHPAVLTKQLLDNIEQLKEFSRKESDNKFNNLITLLSDIVDVQIETICEYLSITDFENCDLFLKNLISRRQDLFVELLKGSDLATEKADFVLAKTIQCAQDYSLCDKDRIVASYLGKHHAYMQIFSLANDDAKSKKFIETLGVKFEDIEENLLDGELQQFIISHNHYALTVGNLAMIFSIKDDNDDFYKRNYGFIMQSNNSSVIQRIRDNISDYVQFVLLDEHISCEREEQDAIYELLLNETISTDMRVTLIGKINVKYENIDDFNKDLFQALLNNGAVGNTWRNVEYAFEKNGFECVKEYLNKINRIEGAFCELDGIGTEIPTTLIDSILINMDSAEIRKLAKTLPAITSLSGLTLSKIADENLAVFVELNKIKYDNADLQLLYKFPKSLCEYVKKYNDNIMDNFDAFFAVALPQEKTQNRQVTINGRLVMQPVVVGYTPKPNAQEIIATTIGCKGIDINIKKMLIDKCQAIIDIKGTERTYIEYIIDEGQAVPSIILWQYTNVPEIVTTDEKKTALAICIENVDAQKDLAAYKAYIKTIWRSSGLFATDEFRIAQTDDNEKLLKVLKNKGLAEYRRSHSKKENKFIVKIG